MSVCPASTGQVSFLLLPFAHHPDLWPRRSTADCFASCAPGRLSSLLSVLSRTEVVATLLLASRQARPSILLHRRRPLLPLSLRPTTIVALAAVDSHCSALLYRLRQHLSLRRLCPNLHTRRPSHSDTTRHNGSVQSPAGCRPGFDPHGPRSQPWCLAHLGRTHDICRPSCTFAYGGPSSFASRLGVLGDRTREMEADETSRTQRYGFTLCCRRLHGAPSSLLAWS